MNKIILSGRITGDPELKTTNSAIEVCNFSVAVDRKHIKGKEKETDFVYCTAWGKTGAFISTYFHKGDGIFLEGRLESNKYTDKNGQTRVSWAVTVEQVEFPIGKGKSNQSDSVQPTQFEIPNMEEIGKGEELPF